MLLLLQMQLMRTKIVVTKTMIVVVIIVVVVVVEKVTNQAKKINVKGVIMKTVKTTIVMAKAVLTKISHLHQAQLT